MLDRAIEGKMKLCHGAVTLTGGPNAGVRAGHAWLEYVVCGITFVIDVAGGKEGTYPAELYYRVGQVNPEEIIRYDKVELVEEILTHEHWGPWHPSFYTTEANLAFA